MAKDLAEFKADFALKFPGKEAPEPTKPWELDPDLVSALDNAIGLIQSIDGLAARRTLRHLLADTVGRTISHTRYQDAMRMSSATAKGDTGGSPINDNSWLT